MRPVKIIAEIGINHNGDIGFARALASLAKAAGCDAVKIQKREPDWCYSPEELASPCESPWGSTLKHKVVWRELSWEGVEEFDKHCQKIGIPWFASCFDLFSYRELKSRFWSRTIYNKIPSAMFISGREPFLREVAEEKKLTLISTGLCSGLDEIKGLIQIFESAGCPYVLNHCAPYYPCPPSLLNLNFIKTLSNVFMPSLWTYQHCRGIGYSGHEVGVLPSVIAVYMGATYVERHITFDRATYGADQAASLEPEGLRRLVRDIRSLEGILGDGAKVLRGDEKNPIKFFRTS